MNKVIDEIMTKLDDPKYQGITSNLEFITECGLEDSDHVRMVKDAIEYINILEEGMIALRMYKSERDKNLSSLIIQWEALNIKLNKVEKKIEQDPNNDLFKSISTKTQYRINEIEQTLAIMFNYNILDPDGGVNK